MRLLDGIIGDRQLLSEMIAGGALDRLANEDRARAQRLATMTLRSLGRADAILGPHLRKSPPLPVRNALRLGCVELCGGAAAHGVVNSIVSIIGGGKRTASYRGLCNAVLRKVAQTGPQRWPGLPPPRVPAWLRPALIDAWGKRAVRDMESTFAEAPPTDLTARGDAHALAGTVGGEVLPTGSVRLRDVGQISMLPGYSEGMFWVQDAAAALPARILNAGPGDAILDLCAAPGGKTLQLAAAGGRVTAVDVSGERLGRLRENLGRTGLRAEIVETDGLTFDRGGFDAVLLDAPCSATGTIRRHPDLPFAKDGSDFSALFDLQERLIDRAIACLRPGGRLVFCTCSLLPDEGEVQVDRALARHPGLVADTAPLHRPGIDPAWVTEEGGLRVRPDYWRDTGGLDGFYIACLAKPA